MTMQCLTIGQQAIGQRGDVVLSGGTFGNMIGVVIPARSIGAGPIAGSPDR
jgi:hypothetical protein